MLLLSLFCFVSQGNEYFQRKSYLTALHEYSVSVLSAPSIDDVTGQNPVTEISSIDIGAEESVSSDTGKQVDDNTENKSPGNDVNISTFEQKSDGDGVKTEDKSSNKTELALAYANRFGLYTIDIITSE